MAKKLLSKDLAMWIFITKSMEIMNILKYNGVYLIRKRCMTCSI